MRRFSVTIYSRVKIKVLIFSHSEFTAAILSSFAFICECFVDLLELGDITDNENIIDIGLSEDEW